MMTHRTKTLEQLDKLCQEAWDWLWKDNLKSREEGSDYNGQSYYLTASDVESQVRAFAEEDLEGVPRGSKGRGCYLRGVGGLSLRVSVPSRYGNLLGYVRSWLRSQERAGKLASHNFGRGHISGQRYRPAGEPLSKQEQKTVEKKSKPKLVHLEREYTSLAACASVRKSRGMGRRPRRSTTRTTSDLERVTCPRCRKHVEVRKQREEDILGAAGNQRYVAILPDGEWKLFEDEGAVLSFCDEYRKQHYRDPILFEIKDGVLSRLGWDWFLERRQQQGAM